MQCKLGKGAQKDRITTDHQEVIRLIYKTIPAILPPVVADRIKELEETLKHYKLEMHFMLFSCN